MNAANYTTKDGDSLDAIVFSYYGSTLKGQVEATLAANQALDLGKYITFPAGVIITLPAFVETPAETVRLFS